MAELDTDSNGKIDAADNVYNSLLVWRDANSDGVSTLDEIQSLASHGVNSIELAASAVNRREGDVLVTHESIGLKADLSEVAIEAAWFASNQLLTRFEIPANAVVAGDALLIPFLYGYGNIPDLQYAASQNASLLASTIELIDDAWTLDSEQLRASFDDLLYVWSGVNAIDPLSRGPNVDARQIAVLEKLYDQALTGALPSPADGRFFHETFTEIRDGWLVRFLGQVGGAKVLLADNPLVALDSLTVEDLVFASAGYNLVHDTVTVNYSGLTNLMMRMAQTDQPDALSRLDNVFSLLTGLRGASTYSYIDTLLTHISQISDTFTRSFLTDLAGGARYSGGSSAADTIVTAGGLQIVEGGGGDDVLNAGAADDTYLYSRGDGADTILEAFHNGSADKLVLRGISPVDASLLRNGNDVTIVIAESEAGAGDAGSIVLRNSLDENSDQGVEQVLFGDGTVWTRADLRVALLLQASTVNNDTIVGFNTDDYITGGIGDDAIDGSSGSDTYVYARGDGHDTITEQFWNGWSDKLVLAGINPSDISLVRSGEDFTIVVAESALGAGDAGSIFVPGGLGDTYQAGVEQVVFENGTTWSVAQMQAMLLLQASSAGADTLTGFMGADDVLRGEGGDDALDGRNGSDTYVYARGDGHDAISESDWNGWNDRLVFEGINASDVTLVRSNDDVTLFIAESAPGANDGGSILLSGGLRGIYQSGVEQIVFANGTTWSVAQMQDMLVQQSATTGNDLIFGTWSADDTIRGGKGDDVLHGQSGSDNYIYARGDGHDTIHEGTWNGWNDRLVLEGIDQASVSLVRSGEDVTIVIAESAPGANDAGSIFIPGGLGGMYDGGVEKIVFSGGTMWSVAQMQAIALQNAATSGNDNLTGFWHSNDVIRGGTGDDIVNGLNGNDSYVYARGDGHDTINDTDWNGWDDRLVLEGINPEDVSVLRSNEDVTIVIAESASGAGNGGSIFLPGGLRGTYQGGIEQIIFANGTSWSVGQLQTIAIEQAATSGNDQLSGFWNRDDTLRGEEGNDTLQGLSGNDTYLYARGDGHDIIQETDWNGWNDRLVFENIDPEDVTLVRSGEDVTIVIAESASNAGDSGSIFLAGGLRGSNQGGVEQIVFGNGTTWSLNQMQTMVIESAASSGDDQVQGFWNRDDVLQGDAGDDTLYGLSGNDLYSYHRGDGHDTIFESDWNGWNDQLVLHGINPGEVTATRSNDDVTLIIGESSPGANDAGSIFLPGGLRGTYQSSVEQIIFANGTQWSVEALRQRVLETGFTAGDDTVHGYQSNDLILGGAGNDTIFGHDGEDTIVGGLGDNTLTGGQGNDSFVFSFASGSDAISDFAVHAGSINGDTLELQNQTTMTSFAAVMTAATEYQGTTYLHLDGGSEVALDGVSLSQLSVSDFRFV